MSNLFLYLSGRSRSLSLECVTQTVPDERHTLSKVVRDRKIPTSNERMEINH